MKLRLSRLQYRFVQSVEQQMPSSTVPTPDTRTGAGTVFGDCRRTAVRTTRFDELDVGSFFRVKPERFSRCGGRGGHYHSHYIILPNPD